jgi:hypothetical protein
MQQINVVDDTEHSALSASSSHRWTLCPISLATKLHGSSGEAAAEGTLGHYISEHVLRGAAYPAVGTTATVGKFTFTITEDFLRDIAAYVDWVRRQPWVGSYAVEARVNYARSLGVPFNLAFGTSDCWGFTDRPEGRVLEVADLKMGRNPVAPDRNTQHTHYAGGVLDGLLPALMLPRNFPVRFTIFQPRLSHLPYQWTTTVGWVEDKMAEFRNPAQAAVRFMQGTATAEDRTLFPELPGDHCQYCPRRPECKAFNERVASIGGEGQKVVWRPDIFRMRSAITGYLEDMEQLARDEGERGNPLPGTKMVKGRSGKPYLVVDENKLRAIAQQKGVLDRLFSLEPTWATPAKIRDTFKEIGMAPEDIRTIVKADPGRPIVADADDPREPWNPTPLAGFTATKPHVPNPGAATSRAADLSAFTAVNPAQNFAL